MTLFPGGSFAVAIPRLNENLDMRTLKVLTVLGALLALTSTALAYTCDKRENSYLGCTACPTNDTESNAFKKISTDCNQCRTRCGSTNPRVLDPGKSGATCGSLPTGTTEIHVLVLSVAQLEAIAEINPYLAVALLYSQLGDSVLDQSPFGGMTRFGASVTRDQAKQGVRDPKSLEYGRSVFDEGYSVTVEDSVDFLESGTVDRIFRTYYRAPDGSKVAISEPISLKLLPALQKTDAALPGITITEYQFSSLEKLGREPGM